MEDLLQVGAFTKTHGIKGEINLFPMTDDVRRFKKLKKAIVDLGREKIEVEIEGAKFFKQMVILKIKGYDSIEEVQKFAGKGLFVTRDNAVRLSKDEYFIADLIDMKICDEEDNIIGLLKDVIQTGANDVYDIALEDGRQLLLPAIKECVLNVDMNNNIMKIHILDGLLD